VNIGDVEGTKPIDSAVVNPEIEKPISIVTSGFVLAEMGRHEFQKLISAGCSIKEVDMMSNRKLCQWSTCLLYITKRPNYFTEVTEAKSKLRRIFDTAGCQSE
jgi:hypothetical protein